jgi:type III pantothenate kinase
MVVVDVGNTRIKWGLCADDRVQKMRSLHPEDAADWEECLLSWNAPADFRWVVSGVHPARIEVFTHWLAKRIASKWKTISSKDQIPVEVCIEAPDKVGLDRLFNATAVNVRRGPGQRAVVVDAGSAVTVDYVDEEGKFQGGAIFPGLRLMAQALHAYTAKLPVVNVSRRLRSPEKSTDRAIELGVFHAVLGGIELLIRDLRGLAPDPPVLFFGGGDAALLAPHLPWPATVWPEMTLEGIRIAGELLF